MSGDSQQQLRRVFRATAGAVLLGFLGALIGFVGQRFDVEFVKDVGGIVVLASFVAAFGLNLVGAVLFFRLLVRGK